VRKFISEIDSDTLVVLDCAYNDFAAHRNKNKAIAPADVIALPNVLYLGTFSKLYALGGMRVGYGIANEQITAALSKVRPPFNITNVSLLAARVALSDSEFARKTLKTNLKEMKIYEKFAAKHKLKFIKSYTNFIALFLPDNLDSTAICDALLRQGIIIRNLRSYGLNAVRITIGTQRQNVRVLKALKKLLKNG